MAMTKLISKFVLICSNDIEGNIYFILCLGKAKLEAPYHN